MANQQRIPRVAVICDSKEIDGHTFQVVYEKYVTAMTQGSDALPLLLPVLREPLDIKDILGAADGLLMTGSRSNIHPDHYDGSQPREGVLLDVQRDATSLALIRAALETELPLLCICRGIQEFNVALGGSLHQHIHEVDGRLRHHEDDNDSLDVQYGPSHKVTLKPNGYLHNLLGEEEIMVNSLHQQCIDRLAENLIVEAWAPDSTIEAVMAPDSNGFNLGVQWHPEWKLSDNPNSLKLFKAFGDAMRDHMRDFG